MSIRCTNVLPVIPFLPLTVSSTVSVMAVTPSDAVQMYLPESDGLAPVICRIYVLLNETLIWETNCPYDFCIMSSHQISKLTTRKQGFLASRPVI